MHVTINNNISYKIDKLKILESIIYNTEIKSIYFNKCIIHNNIFEYLLKLDITPFIILEKCTIQDPFGKNYGLFEKYKKYIKIQKIMLVEI